MAQVTLKSGFDVDYHLGQVGVDYHLTAGGEPPGRWMGRGAQALGLSGPIGGTSAEGKANAEAMRGLYHYDVAPDGTHADDLAAQAQVPGQERPGSRRRRSG